MPDREREVGRAFVALADSLTDDYDVVDLLDQLARHSVSLLAAEWAGILLGDDRGRLRTAASSSDAAEILEALQVQGDEGPCPDSFRTLAAVSVPDISREARRWPRFVATVTGAGYSGSVHALPLRLRGRAIGALNLFHRAPGPLPGADLALAQALADVATIAVLSERAISDGETATTQLQTALNSRVVVEQAKGVVAQTLGVGMDDAFERLRGYSRHHNIRLSEVAHQVTVGALLADALTDLPASTRKARRSGSHGLER